MTKDELIQRKSEEIKRLHKVCMGKDMQIKRAISCLELCFINTDNSLLRSEITTLVESLNNTIG